MGRSEGIEGTGACWVNCANLDRVEELQAESAARLRELERVAAEKNAEWKRAENAEAATDAAVRIGNRYQEQLVAAQVRVLREGAEILMTAYLNAGVFSHEFECPARRSKNFLTDCACWVAKAEEFLRPAIEADGDLAALSPPAPRPTAT